MRLYTDTHSRTDTHTGTHTDTHTLAHTQTHSRTHTHIRTHMHTHTFKRGVIRCDGTLVHLLGLCRLISRISACHERRRWNIYIYICRMHFRVEKVGRSIDIVYCTYARALMFEDFVFSQHLIWKKKVRICKRQPSVRHLVFSFVLSCFLSWVIQPQFNHRKKSAVSI